MPPCVAKLVEYPSKVRATFGASGPATVRARVENPARVDRRVGEVGGRVAERLRRHARFHRLPLRVREHRLDRLGVAGQGDREQPVGTQRKQRTRELLMGEPPLRGKYREGVRPLLGEPRHQRRPLLLDDEQRRRGFGLKLGNDEKRRQRHDQRREDGTGHGTSFEARPSGS